MFRIPVLVLLECTDSVPLQRLQLFFFLFFFFLNRHWSERITNKAQAIVIELWSETKWSAGRALVEIEPPNFNPALRTRVHELRTK